jgi:hypothetical protein
MLANRKYFPISAETSQRRGFPKPPLQCVAPVAIDASGNPHGCTHTHTYATPICNSAREV